MIAKKDWDRMVELVITDKDGDGVASTIKCKKKAMSRYVAGIKLERDELSEPGWCGFRGSFSAFGDRAIELGATFDEIHELYNITQVPTEYFEKIEKYKGKKVHNRFVGFISKMVIDAGCDIEFLPHNGYAITQEGKRAMEINGRKWTIGYKTRIKKGDSVVDFIFDAITCEGGGATQYVTYGDWARIGKKEITSIVKDIIDRI